MPNSSAGNAGEPDVLELEDELELVEELALDEELELLELAEELEPVDALELLELDVVGGLLDLSFLHAAKGTSKARMSMRWRRAIMNCLILKKCNGDSFGVRRHSAFTCRHFLGKLPPVPYPKWAMFF